MNIIEERKERAILVGVCINKEPNFEHSMEELGELAKACDMEVICIHTQNLPSPNTGLYIGTGKVEEIKESAALMEADVVIFDNALSPIQLRNLSSEIQLPIWDRTSLILQIFATRAQTKEAKLQVELARYQYMLPRLVGLRTSLGRQGGGSGSMSNKGSGEKKIELDRRRIEQRITELKKEVVEVAKDRETKRKQRMSSSLPQVALVGYTNAGKSTLMNQLVDLYVKDDLKKVFEKDMLFATLETTIRKIMPEDNKGFLLSDTVGFIDKLPHSLIKAFHSTLEEVVLADVLLHVIDFSDENNTEHVRVTTETLTDLKASHIPVIYVYNKADKSMPLGELPKVIDNKIYMSAKLGIGFPELLQLISDIVYGSHVTCDMLLPYDKGNILSYLLENATVHNCEYTADGTLIHLECSKEDNMRYKEYILVEN
ncbi:MAG: GTPase HflX [Eubacteriales bacterium]